MIVADRSICVFHEAYMQFSGLLTSVHATINLKPTNDVIGVDAFHKVSVPTILRLISLGLNFSNRVFSHNVTAAIGVPKP